MSSTGSTKSMFLTGGPINRAGGQRQHAIADDDRGSLLCGAVGPNGQPSCNQRLNHPKRSR